MTEFKACKEQLKHCYCKRPNQKKSTRWPIELGDPILYVDVTVVRAKILGCSDKGDYSYVTVDELLKDGYGKINLIQGDPGVGKTTFSFQICKEWAGDKLSMKILEDVVFWIPLRHYKSVRTISELFDELGHPNMMRYTKQYSGKGLVLILDGWDELPNHLQTASLFHDIVYGKITDLSLSTIIVTSRPTCSGELAKAVQGTNSYYQILGFNQQMTVTYINSYFHSNPPSAKSLLEFLDSNEYFHQRQFCIPVSIAIMCFVYYLDHKQIPLTSCRLYERFVVLYLRFNAPEKCHQEMLKFENIRSVPKSIESPFRQLCKLAFDMLKGDKLELYEKEFEDMLDRLQLKQFDGFGLLHVDHNTSQMATTTKSYSFLYREVQELLAANFILNNGKTGDLLVEHFKEGSYLLHVFPFLFSLASKKVLKPLVKKLTHIFMSNKRLLRLSLHCLFEAGDKTLCREFGKAFKEKSIMVTMWSYLDFHCACYFISVCDIQGVNVLMRDYITVSSCDLQSYILCKYLQNASTNIASFCYSSWCTSMLSHKGTEQFAKALSGQRNLLTLELVNVQCMPGSITILCNSICEHNCHITKLELWCFGNSEFSKNDLESIGSLLTTCSSFKRLHMNCSPSEGVCLDLSSSFCKALRETKSLENLYLPLWSLSEADSKVFGEIVCHNCSLKKLHLKVVTVDCMVPFMEALFSIASPKTFDQEMKLYAIIMDTSELYLHWSVC